MKTYHIFCRSIFLLCLCVSVILPARVLAQRSVEGIAAIVNDEVISLYDVDQRVDLFFATSGINKTPEVVDQLRGQVLRSLVDEKLQMQEAARVEIAVDEKEVENNLERLANGNNMSVAEITTFLGENKIRPETLKAQIEAELAWNQYVRRRFGNALNVDARDVDEQYQRAVQALDEPRFLISEILLARDNFTDGAQIQGVSNEIVKQLKNNVDFGAVARQFSVSPSAAQGGSIGWVSAGQLDPAITRALLRMSSGQVSPPISTLAGLYIILLRDRVEGGGRDPLRHQFDLLQIEFDKKQSAQSITHFVDNFSTCKAARQDAQSQKARATRTGLVELRSLRAELHPILIDLEAGQIAAPRQTETGTQIIILCDRKDHQGVQISRDAIANNIYSQRVSMLARRHLRDLHRDAIVEYR